MRILLADLSSLIHQIPTTAHKLKTSTGLFSGHVYSFLKKIPKLKTLDPDAIVFCLDAGHDERDRIDPNYKANRDNKTGTLVADILPLLSSLSVFYCKKKGYEADDLLFTLAYHLHEDHEIIVLSKDYDVSYNLIFYPDVRHFFTIDKEILPISLYMRFGCTPSQLLLYKAIFGDSSDNIDGLKLGRGKRTVVNAFTSADTLKDIIKEVPRKYYPKVLKNLRLVRPRIVSGIKVGVGETNRTQIMKFLRTYEIRSFTPHSIADCIPENKKHMKTVLKEIKNA